MSNANGLMAHVAFAKGTWPKRPLPKMQPEWPNMVFAKVLAMHFWSSRAFVLVVWLLWQKLDKEAALWLHHCLWQKSLGTRCCSRKQKPNWLETLHLTYCLSRWYSWISHTWTKVAWIPTTCTWNPDIDHR